MVELYPKVGDEEKKILHLFVLDGSGLNRRCLSQARVVEGFVGLDVVFICFHQVMCLLCLSSCHYTI